MQNHAKTARQISKTDFYFVTCFYSNYDICISDGIRHPNVELGVLTRCLITDKLQFICESICYIRQGFNKTKETREKQLALSITELQFVF